MALVLVVIVATAVIMMSLQPQGATTSLPQTQQAISVDSSSPAGGGAIPDQI